MPSVPTVFTMNDLRDWPAVGAALQPPARLAVFGDPIAHSASPPMHNPALRALGIDAQYIRLHVPPADLAEALQLVARHGFLGVNLTIPHKLDVLPMLHNTAPAALQLGAVNTVVVRDGQFSGHNTDGPGLALAVRAEFGAELRDLRILVLGAGGGAGRATAVQCALEGCPRLVLANRTLEKLAPVAAAIAALPAAGHPTRTPQNLRTVSSDEQALREEMDSIDLIINASSVGMKSSDPLPLPAALLRPHHMVYDMVYAGGQRTRFAEAALQAGARSAGGLTMLLYQGVLAFEIWFQQTPPVDLMRDSLMQYVLSLKG